MRRRYYQTGIPYVSVVFDKSISNPENITIQDNEAVLDSILSQFRRCLCKKTDDGEATVCYLDDNNSNFYEDGSAAVLTGEEGDVMVNFPEFWYKWVKIDDNRFAYRFSLFNVDGDYKHVPRSLVGAYKGYVDGDKLYSRSGVSPTVNKSANDFYVYASNRGLFYQCIDFQQHCVIAFMLYSKYKNRDLQAVLGAGGAVGGTLPTATGSSDSTGIADTKNEISKYVCGLGLEGVFGGIYEWVEKVKINNHVWTITDPDYSTRDINAGLKSGWITNVSAENGPFFDMVPTNVGENKIANYSDYYYQGENNQAFVRSCNESDMRGGVAFTRADYNNLTANSGYGSRLALRGFFKEYTSVSLFKSLPLL